MTSLLKIIVVIVLVAVLASILFGIIGFLGGVIWFLVKLAVVIIVAYAIVRYVLSKA